MFVAFDVNVKSLHGNNERQREDAVIPHPPISFAIVGVDADGSFTVLHGSCVVPQLTVSCSSAQKNHKY